MRYVFDDYVLDAQRYEFWCRDEPIKLRPKVFQVLTYLIEHRGRVVSKDELLEQLWPGQFIGDGSLNACLMAVRKAVGDSGQTQHYIQTLHGRGYRFIAEVASQSAGNSAPPAHQTQPCAACQHENPSHASFCNACGMPLGGRCPSCQASNPAEARFCNRCGALLHETVDAPSEAQQTAEVSPPGAERRQITVMFCDLAGATALSGQLDPEDWHQVVRAYQQTCAHVIQSFEGHIAQYLGDGLLTYFGYPLAHEDDAQRAIRAGLGILTALETLNARLDRELGVELAIRIGIHSGLVVVGEVGSGARLEHLALGQTPNLAARLQDIAAPNTVVISAATHRLTEGYFICEPLGIRDLKGVEQPVAAYWALRDSGAQSRLDVAAARDFTPLVGRQSEIALLQDRWDQVREGIGQVVLLSGEAGIGKSRLVEVLKNHVRHAPHTRLECRCLPYAQHSAWHPILDLLPRLLQWSQADSTASKRAKLETFLRARRFSLEETVPLLSTLLSLPSPEEAPLLARLSPQEQRQQLLDVLIALLLSFAREQPLLLIVEDVHWIDPSTLELLNLVVDQGPTASICTLLTCRPAFQPTWGMRAHLWPLALGRLPRSQAEQMVERVADGKRLPPEVAALLVDKTDGVPLFIEEMTKTVIESGYLQEQDGEYTLSGPLPDLAIPATLQDSLMARLDRLDTAKPIAQLGAAIGREFSYGLLRAVARVEEDVLRRELDQLIKAELVYQRGVLPQATYLFKHALIQDAAYQSLLKQTRQQYHSRIVEVLETQFPSDVATQPDLLAYHATEAGLTALAIDYWQRAGEYAFQRGAYQEAADHFRQGLALLQALPEGAGPTQREFDLLLGLGPSLLVIHGANNAEVERVHARIYALCQHIESTPQLFAALRGVRYFYWVQAQLKRARELETQLLALAQSQQSPALLVEAHMHMGLSLNSMGEFAAALDHFEQALSHFDPALRHTFQNIPHPEVACLLYSGFGLMIMGYPDQARTRIHEGIAVAQQLSHPLHLIWGEHVGATFYQLCREPLAAREWADAVAAHTSEHGLRFATDTAQFVRGWVLSQEGGGEAGIEHIRQGIAVYRARNGDLSMPRWFAYLAEAHGRLGQIETGLQVLAEAQALVDKNGDCLFEAEIHRLKGKLLYQQAEDKPPEDRAGDGKERPEASFLRALDVARQQGAKLLELRAAVSLSQLWQQQGKRAEARELLAQTYAWFTEGFDTVDLREAKALLDELRP